jgi:Transposase DDE domain
MPRRDFRRVRDRFARDDGLPFGRLLPRDYVLSVLESEGHKYRNRTFCPLVTLWGWLSQCLSQDKSLNEAVSRILAHRVASGLAANGATSSSYSEARSRFPLAVMERMAKEIGRKVHGSADDSWNWRGHPVFLADGTCFSMPDTLDNKLVYPQPPKLRDGWGFPVMRSVALISLATGAVVDMSFAPYAGKGTGETRLLRDIMGSLSPGDVLVADKYYPSYFTVAALQKRGVELVSISHGARIARWHRGIKLSKYDHIDQWRKPSRPEWMSEQEYETVPDRITVREFAIDIDGRDGPDRLIIVSTMADPTISQKELSDLYWARWNCEVDIRSIKHSLHMDVLRCKTPEMVHKEIWCHMLAYNLLRGTMVESAKRNEVLPRQISVKGAMQAVESFTPVLMAIDGNAAIYDAFLGTVAAHRVGNRPGRLEPRLKKRYPAWREYMNKPRNSYPRRLASVARS